jgi:para-nitrobenzyl esterase
VETRASGARDVHELDVRVSGGVVRGIREADIEAWRGIPYAAPPVGALRFRAPAPVLPWQGVRDASRHGAVAPQSRRGQFLGAPSAIPRSEDCLNLLVLRGADARTGANAARGDDLAPVMVFIHGGAYSVGSVREVPHQGMDFARNGVIYVAVSYRLGALGYLDFSSYSTPERPFESNLGLRDQVAALAWVRDNIRAFGGDPGNVTVFGESAGANAVTTLMTVPAAAGLFHRAIAQSPPPNALYLPELTARWAGQFLELLSSALDNGSVEATSHEDAAALLTGAPVDALVAATNALQLRTPDEDPGTLCLCPVIDGDYLPERPLDAFKHGRAHRVPLIIGTNDREGSLFTGRLDILASTPPRIRAIFARTRKKTRKAIKAEYPGLPARRAAADFAGDYSFWYPSIKVAERHARYAPVYMYRFDIAPRLVRLAGFDATHGLELFALFDRMNGWFGRTMTVLGGRRAFLGAGRRMRRWWLDFVRTGDPNAQTGAVSPAWPRYDAESDDRYRLTLIIDEVDRVECDPRGERRVAWQEFVPHV